MNAALEVRASGYPLFLRVVIVLLFGPLLILQMTSALSAPPSVAPWLFLVWTLPLLLIWAALRGLLSWPIRAELDSNGNVLRSWNILGSTQEIDLQQIQGLARRRFWHGGRTMFDGFILYLPDGRRVMLSEGNLRPLAPLLDAIRSKGIPEVPRSR